MVMSRLSAEKRILRALPDIIAVAHVALALPKGVNVVALSVLRTLAERPRKFFSNAEIDAESVAVHASADGRRERSAAVTSLEKRGLVSRRYVGKALRVKIRAAGAKLLKDLSKVQLERIDAVLQAIPGIDKNRFADYIEAVLAGRRGPDAT